jgi:cytochrome c biogenesis protein CcmG/thiol:disulfide interchange protein DsbE
VGSPAPDFTLRTLDGVLRHPQQGWGAQDETLTLGELRGHPVLVNFWASWCLACRAEAPDLQTLYADYQNRGLIILGVNATQQDTVAEARAYVSEFKLTFPIPLDEKGDVVKAYGVLGLPTTFFIDTKGTIRHVVIGQMSRATMVAGLELIRSW